MQKVLALAGIGSRRKAETAIILGKVKVNGAVVVELGTTVDIDQDIIEFEGKMIKLPEFSYYALNKPRGYLTTMKDDRGRPTVMELMKGVKERVFPVGRLDYASEGLLLFTNDGDLAAQILHPSGGILRTYIAKLRKKMTDKDLKRLRNGIRLKEGLVMPRSVKRHRQLKTKEWIEIELFEGRNLEVRRMFGMMGYEVDRLRRIAIGPIQIHNIPVGKFRELSKREVQAVVGFSVQDPKSALPKKKVQPHGARRGNGKRRK